MLLLLISEYTRITLFIQESLLQGLKCYLSYIDETPRWKHEKMYNAWQVKYANTTRSKSKYYLSSFQPILPFQWKTFLDKAHLILSCVVDNKPILW